MNAITVDRNDLLIILRKNRDEHRDLFLRAQEGFREEFIKILESRLEDARKNKRVDMHIALDVPIDQTKEYDRAIKMLEMTLKETIDLSENDFKNYVMNDWSWMPQVTISNTKYLK